MMNKEVFLKMVKSYRLMKTTAAKLGVQTCDDDACEAYGYLLDAIYAMMDEKTMTVDESMTYTVLNSQMSDDECAAVLFTFYDRMNSQPAPVFFTEDDLKRMQYGYFPAPRKS